MTDIQKLINALKPFAEAVGIFGKDWMDDDELSVTPFFGEDEQRPPYIENNTHLFTLKVGDLRRAAEAYAALEAAMEFENGKSWGHISEGNEQ